MEKINYNDIIEKHSWVVQRDQFCILSPDSDGLLCGLLMAKYFNWKIKGFYDGKVLILDKELKPSDCVFLDMEVFRKNIRSIGHHMVQYNKKKIPENWNNYKNCIQPNNLRNYDGKSDFKLKYPLATIHILIGIVSSKIEIEIPETAICPLLYTDGVFKNLFGYPENCIDWLKYLRADEENSSLKKIFFNNHYFVHDLMHALKDFFEKLGSIGEKKRGNDKIKISNSKGNEVNLFKENNIYNLEEIERCKSEKFLNILSSLTGWNYDSKNWQWDNFELYKFSKGSKNPNNKNFEEMISKNPITWAMTSGLAIEYTIDKNNYFLM